MKTDNNDRISGKSPVPEVNPDNFDSYALPDETVPGNSRTDSSAQDDGFYYNLEEEEESGDVGGTDDDETDDPVTPEDGGSPSPSGAMFRTLLTPVEGWKSLKRAAFSPEHFASACFLPMVALASVSEFAVYIYDRTVSLSHMLVEALVTFISFYLGYYMALLLARVFSPARCGKALESRFGRVFMMDSMSTLALFFSLMKIFPMVEPVLVFLPLWTIYCIFRGVRYIRVPRDRENILMVVICISVIGSPFLLNWLLHMMLPQV